MKRALIVILATASCAFAQERQEKRDVIYQTVGVAGVAAAGFDRAPEPILGAPYSATITNESVETLSDGNRIVHKTTGTTARDSQGRTRQDTSLPAIGNLSAANAPHLIFIHDPVAQVSYTLNMTQKTAQKMPKLPPTAGPGGPGVAGAAIAWRVVDGDAAPAQLPPPEADAMPVTVAATAPEGGAGAIFEKHVVTMEQDKGDVEDLGSQTMEGVLVTGLRTTHTIPAGQIGNEKPITTVTEVWSSPELKTVVYSKRTDPRMGEQTFRLTNIVRAEPSRSLFAAPADFKIVDGPQTFIYKTKQ